MMGLSLIIIVLFAGAGLYAYHCFQGPGGEAVQVVVPKGAVGTEIADILYRKKVVRDPRLFRAVMRFAGTENDIKPGTYTLDPSENMLDIARELVRLRQQLRLVSVPEGLTLRETAARLAENGAGDYEKLMELCLSGAFRIGEENPRSLEGYLLPDTYDFPEYYDEEQIIGTMIGAFSERFLPLYIQYKGDLPYPLSLPQLVTLASMVEREASVASERPEIAAVYYNRLKKGMKMECDATVQYALGKQKEILLYSDLKIDSPYNTYKYEGLPPGPIANPGLDALRAALRPAEHGYLYYVRNDLKNDGSHIFSRTFAEHEAAIQKYQK